MTDNLVKRLRPITDIKVLCKDCYKSFEAAEEAADRIEALEAALREIESVSVSSGGEIHGMTAKHWRDAFEQCRDISRAALAGEKKDE